MPIGPDEYLVDVKVTNLGTAGSNSYYLKVDPERVLLDGKSGNKIIITMKGGEDSVAVFLSKDDIEFKTAKGKERFSRIEFENVENGRIIATAEGEEENETIYTYFINAHIIDSETVIRVDPEADNPPPPPQP